MLNSIDSTDISVVVQGAIHNKFTKKSLSSIRKYLPEAEIILSTWEGTDTSNLDYDIILLNKDPGAHVFDCNGRVQNQNRQIVSTKNGIKKASRKYVLKIRSDMQIQGTKFLHFFDKYNDFLCLLIYYCLLNYTHSLLLLHIHRFCSEFLTRKY